jgi:hypothetical protein
VSHREGGAGSEVQRGPLPLAGLIPVTRWWAEYQGHEIVVWTSGPFQARLYVDGRRCDRRLLVLTMRRDLPVLAARLPVRPGLKMVEVYLASIFPCRPVVRVDGRTIETRRL